MNINCGDQYYFGYESQHSAVACFEAFRLPDEAFASAKIHGKPEVISSIRAVTLPFSMVGTFRIHARMIRGIYMWCQISLFPCKTTFGTWKSVLIARPSPYIHFAKQILEFYGVAKNLRRTLLGQRAQYSTHCCKGGMLFGVEYTVPSKYGQESLGNVLN